MAEARTVSDGLSDVSFPMEANLVYNRSLDSFGEKVSHSLDNRELLYPDYYGGLILMMESW